MSGWLCSSLSAEYTEDNPLLLRQRPGALLGGKAMITYFRTRNWMEFNMLLHLFIYLFAWVDGIADYNIDYVKVKGEKKEITFIIVNNNNNNNNNNNW